MKDKSKDFAQRLRKFSKEQIIEALTSNYHAEYLLGNILTELEYKAGMKAIDAHTAAVSAELAAATACMEWRREMCSKYGNDGKVKLSDIPQAEITNGAKLEQRWKEAQEKEKALDRKVDKMLDLGGTRK